MNHLDWNKRANRYAAFIKDYCISHEFCRGCGLPHQIRRTFCKDSGEQTSEKVCLCAKDWDISEEYNYPELINENLFEDCRCEEYNDFANNLANKLLGSSSVPERFWYKLSNTEYIAVVADNNGCKKNVFDNELDCHRFISGWSISEIEDFHELEDYNEIAPEKTNELFVSYNNNSWLYYKTGKKTANEAYYELLDNCEAIGIDISNMFLDKGVLMDENGNDIDNLD